MKTYKTPVYPALAVRLPGEGRRTVKAAGGFFNVADEDVADFEAVMAKRPHYRITAVEAPPAEDRAPIGAATDGREVVPTTEADEIDTEIDATDDAADEVTDADGSEHGIVVQPEPISESERHPETVTVEMLEQLNVPTLRERLEAKGLPSDGRKAVLVQRLAEATDTPTGVSDGSTDDADSEDTAE